jgi:hypothetical protein
MSSVEHGEREHVGSTGRTTRGPRSLAQDRDLLTMKKAIGEGAGEIQERGGKVRGRGETNEAVGPMDREVKRGIGDGVARGSCGGLI